MSVINVNDEEFMKTEVYQNFMRENPSYGTLKIRASAASEAVPISGVRIVVSKKIGDDTIIFFEGVTDESGMINNIKLPTPESLNDDMMVPPSTTYEVDAVYLPDNTEQVYPVNVFSGIYVVQTIKITPTINPEERSFYGN